MKEVKSNVEALVQFIRNLTPAQAEKVLQMLPDMKSCINASA